jgi:hypothetical protein
LYDDKEWGTELRGIYLGNKTHNTSIDTKKLTYAKVDTFNSFIQLPIENFKKYKEYLLARHPEMTCLGDYPIITVCVAMGRTCEEISKNYENLTLRFNDTLGYHIPPKSYLKTEKSGGSSNCYNMIIYSSVYDSVVLGDVFLENYYVVYDFDNTTISFNGWVEGNLNIEKSRKGSSVPTIIIVILICIVLVGATAGAVYIIKNRNKKLQQNLALYAQIDDHDTYQKPVIMGNNIN